MLNSVQIGEKHLLNDFKLIMNSKYIAPPEIKENTVDIPRR